MTHQKTLHDIMDDDVLFEAYLVVINNELSENFVFNLSDKDIVRATDNNIQGLIDKYFLAHA